MSDGDFRRPPMLWEQRLAQRVDVNTVGLGISATYEVPEAPAPGDGAPGTDPEVPQPPPAEFAKPSTPVLTGAVQGIRVYWDGLTAAGSTFPVGAAWVEVHSATSGTGFTVGTATLKGRMDYPGEFYLGGLSAGTTYYVRLRGADPQGNYTDASDGVGGQTGVTSSNDYGTATITEGAVSFNARTIGGVTNTVGSVTPTSPVQGDVWLDTSPGTAVIHKVYNGSAWVTNAWGSASIAAGQITALQVAAGAITAGALTADAIDGKTITGATVRTGSNAGGAAAGSKAGVVINSSGLYGYNSGGAETISINASNGAVTIGAIAGTDLIGTAQVNANVTSISGNVITTGTINAARLDLTGVLTAGSVGAGGSTTIDGGRITTGTVAASRLDLTGVLTASSVGAGGSTTIDGGRITTGTINANRILAGTLNASVVDVTNLDASKITAGILSGREIRTSAGGSRIVLADGNTDNLTFYANNGTVASIRGETSKLVLDVGASSEVRVSGKLQVNSTSNFDGDAVFTQAIKGATSSTSNEPGLRVASNGGVYSYGIEDNTSTLAANVRVGTNAQLLRSTSTARVKTDMAPLFATLAGVDAAKLSSQPASVDPYDVLDVAPTEFESLCDTDDGQRMLGFIAEDVAAKFPWAAEWDADGIPSSVQDRPIIAALLCIVRDLTARIEALEG